MVEEKIETVEATEEVPVVEETPEVVSPDSIEADKEAE